MASQSGVGKDHSHGTMAWKRGPTHSLQPGLRIKYSPSMPVEFNVILSYLVKFEASLG